MARGLSLVIDLGDVFTKARIGIEGRAVTHVRYPSVVAHRLLEADRTPGELVLGPHDVLRPEDFDPGRFPRTRSYAGGEQVVRRSPSVARARYAGWIAVACGADRTLLGAAPDPDVVETLVHKALLETPPECDRAEVALVVDIGAKANAIAGYVERGPTMARFQVRDPSGTRSPARTVAVHPSIVDAADCTVAALGVGGERLLVVDVGYRRTKLAFVSARGCERQVELEGVGVWTCVHRVLRDGQDAGLVEDEFAVMVALERAQDVIEVQGRRFDVGDAFGQARAELEGELHRAIERAVHAEVERGGELCRAAALVGGGAALVGDTLGERLKGSGLAVHVGADPYLHVDGALG